MATSENSVLIVDDQLSAREVLRSVLSDQGYHLMFAALGEEALTKATAFTPDLILLDAMMPQMDGFEVCQRLRSQPLTAEIPILMITALDDRESRLNGIEAGVDDFITKPFDIVELRARVRSIMRLNRYRQIVASRIKFDWVVERAQAGYIVLDHKDCILYANANARLFLGLLDNQDATNSPLFLDVCQRQYRFEPLPAWQNWPETLDTDIWDARYLVRPETINTNAFWLQVTTLKLPPGPGGSWLVHLQDVTTQINNQRNKWIFQSLVSHKLRTPVGGVLNSLELLKYDGITELLDPDKLELFELAMRSAHRLEQSVSNILKHITAPTLNQPGYGFDLTNLEELVPQISQELELQAVTFHNNLGNIDPAQTTLSKEAMELVMRELLENAQKFHPNQNPTIEVTVSTPTPQQASIQILDNGINLSPEQLSQVWKPYYQGEKNFTGEIRGMGLGLTSVAELVTSAGGTCRLYNREDGPGIVADLILPLTDFNGTVINV